MIILAWVFAVFCIAMSANDIRLRTPFRKVWWGYVLTAIAIGWLVTFYT